MPFLRVIRDKRGYETTYLMHWFREGSRQQSRIIYAFRTPGGVRVGRAPLEPDVIQQIEARHPEIDFDWPVVLENRQVIESSPEQRRPRKRREARRDDEAARPAPAAPAAAAAAQAPPAPPRVVVPARVEGETPDEQIAFLAQWYATVREQIDTRVADPARREALFALCERLNPANWTDADEITAGLGPAADALERLSHVFAKRRRRARKKRSTVSTGKHPDSTSEHPDSTDEHRPGTDEPPEE
ncbi:MAG: hypothetical protein AB7P99_06210 [Vicinamibacterales bacterium]